MPRFPQAPCRQEGQNRKMSWSVLSRVIEQNELYKEFNTRRTWAAEQQEVLAPENAKVYARRQ